MAYTPLSAGELRHVLDIEAQIEERDSSGSIIVSWQPLFENVYASSEPLSAREIFAANAAQSPATHRFRIRYREGVDATCRVVFRGKVYNIEGVTADNNSNIEWLTLLCSQGLNEGA